MKLQNLSVKQLNEIIKKAKLAKKAKNKKLVYLQYSKEWMMILTNTQKK